MIINTIKQALLSLVPTPLAEPVLANKEDEEKSPKIEKRLYGVVDCDYNSCGYHLDAFVPTDQLIENVKVLDKHNYFIESITGVDWIKEDELEIVYDFCRYDFDLCRVVIRTRVPRDNPKVPTITDIYTGANWHERETHDFFGIKFTGHPHLIPLLLPEDADFHPLLKDFKNE